MRLIDADILYRKLGWSARDCELAEIIEKIPTIDAVEVVRCKDCKEYKYCFLLPNDDDYCSYGERKNDD